MRLSDVKWLYVEPSSRCNAWCSGCRRNNSGYGLNKSDFEVRDLDIGTFEKTLSSLPNLEVVQLGGNFGDPCAGKLIDQQIELLVSKKIKVQIHTNGSLRTKEWWKMLAEKLDDLEVWFAIDGLKDTHNIYRQATDWDKIMGNAKSFIDAGGKAIWQFIPFEHNEHQIKECMQMSTAMGFKKFEFVKNARYPKQAFEYMSGHPVDIKPWSKHEEQWNRAGGKLFKNTTQERNTMVKSKDCMHLALNSLYLSAEGLLAPCCYIYNKTHNSLDIKRTLEQENFLPTCLANCGSHN